MLSCAFVATMMTLSVASTEPAAAPAMTGPYTEGFRFDLNLDAWFPRLVGDTQVVPGQGRIDVSDLDLDGSEVVFAGDATLSLDRWFVRVGGFSFETDGVTPTSTNDAAWWEVSADVGYALWTPFDPKVFPWSDSAPRSDNVAGDGMQRLSLVVAPTLGVTWDEVNIASTTLATGARNAIDGGWAAVRVGADIRLGLHTKDLVGFLDRVEIGASLSVGPSFGVSGDGDGVGTLWTVDAGVRAFFTHNIGVNLGYKLIDGDFDDERNGVSGTSDIGLQGLVAGLAIHF